MITIALIDDHPLMINGIGAWLCSTGRFEVAGTAGSLEGARSLFERLDSMPGIVILDISLGTEDGLSFIPMLKKICAKRKAALPGILVCSVHGNSYHIKRALDLGATAYVEKAAAPSEIITAIDSILEGKTYVNPKYLQQAQNQNISPLTRRETEVAALAKLSLSTKQIAQRLGLSVRTVDNHLARIYAKTGKGSREEL